MSELDNIIPPEIKNDELYFLIQKIARFEQLKWVIEIGSSAGGGSTEAFVTGLRENPHHPTLFCLEVSKPRFTELSARYANDNFVRCYNASSVPASKFPTPEQVAKFYKSIPTILNQYSLDRVLGWLDQDLEYIRTWNPPQNGIEIIKKDFNISSFDMVLIDGSEFSGEAELEEVYGARFILLDDVNAYKNNANYKRLIGDPNYSLIAENWKVRNGYAAFRRVGEAPKRHSNSEESPANSNKANSIPGAATLPVNFLTIVLNGEPFIRDHIAVLKSLPFNWHWHIVEGVAELKHDTAWSASLGGKITSELHANGLSRDGTSKYVDELVAEFPNNVTVYRKPAGQFWDGKLEMVRAPLVNIKTEALLWQLDSDELWTAKQIGILRQMFIANPERTSAWFWCWYFVGPKLIVSTRGGYSQNPNQDWLRVWRYRPGMQWAAHEPPTLVEWNAAGQPVDVGRKLPFSHQETEAAGLVFQHYSYVTPEQIRFKEVYYGYSGAVDRWHSLQQQTQFPQRLRDYFPWVQDETLVDQVEKAKIEVLHQVSYKPARVVASVTDSERPIALDSIFFQINDTGIARLWRALMQEWSNNGFAEKIIVLDRSNKAPRFPGFAYVDVPPFHSHMWQLDQEILQQTLNKLGTQLFISTYYTTPKTTPSLVMVYDMIPEVFGFSNNGDPQWQDKHRAINYARSYVCISENTKKDLIRLFPNCANRSVEVFHPGIDQNSFTQPGTESVVNFHNKHQITKPYFLLIGPALGYKNVEMFFEAVAKLPSQHGFAAVLVGGYLSPEQLASLNPMLECKQVKLDDAELRAAYAGALALVYPSKYEGFGLPILEAQACRCPVITTPFSSVPEVAGASVLYASDANGLADQLAEIQKPTVQLKLIKAGTENVSRFPWSKSATAVQSIIETQLLQATDRSVVKGVFHPIPAHP